VEILVIAIVETLWDLLRAARNDKIVTESPAEGNAKRKVYIKTKLREPERKARTDRSL